MTSAYANTAATPSGVTARKFLITSPYLRSLTARFFVSMAVCPQVYKPSIKFELSTENKRFISNANFYFNKIHFPEYQIIITFDFLSFFRFLMTVRCAIFSGPIRKKRKVGEFRHEAPGTFSEATLWSNSIPPMVLT